MKAYKYTVYCHTNKINGKRYIGITSRNPKERWLNGNGYKGNKHFNNAIKKYGWDNFEHEILFENLTENEAKQKEIELIFKWDTTNQNKGYNISSGGNSNSGFHHKEETRKQLSEINKGKTLSEEHKMKIKESHKGKKHTDETKKKISNARKGKPSSMLGVFGANNHLSKKVARYTKQGEFIDVWECTYDIERKLNISAGNISSCCNGKRKSAGGYIFKYIDDNINVG